MIGPEGLKETVQMFWALSQVGWKGVLEYDCHMLRADGDVDDQIGCRKQFIIDCAEATEMALKLAQRIEQPDLSKNQNRIDLAAIRQMCRLERISGKRS